MPSLSQHQSKTTVKMILMGDPGSGKTGCAESLVAADYKLRILDYDNGLDSLTQQILHKCPDKIDNVDFVTLRDTRKATAEGPLVVNPQAYIKGVRLLDRWKYKDSSGAETDLGVPAEWGSDVVLVLDSLTLFSDAAFNYYEPLVPVGRSGERDGRAIYKNAQDGVEHILALMTGDNMKCNVIVTAHVRFIQRPDGTKKGYPTSVGEKLSPFIGAYFNSIALCETSTGGKRLIKTASTAEIDLKNPNPFEMAKELPLETGLATYFQTLTNQTIQTKPKLRRV